MLTNCCEHYEGMRKESGNGHQKALFLWTLEEEELCQVQGRRQCVPWAGVKDPSVSESQKQVFVRSS